MLISGDRFKSPNMELNHAPEVLGQNKWVNVFHVFNPCFIFLSQGKKPDRPADAVSEQGRKPAA